MDNIYIIFVSKIALYYTLKVIINLKNQYSKSARQIVTVEGTEAEYAERSGKSADGIKLAMMDRCEYLQWIPFLLKVV